MMRGKKRQATLYVVSAGIAVITTILYSIAVFPTNRLDPATALSPVVGLQAVLGGRFLPGTLLLLIAGAVAFIGIRLHLRLSGRTPRRGKNAVGTLVDVATLLCVGYIAAAGIWILAGGSTIAASAEQIMLELLRLLLFPVALILHGAWRTVGWPAYLIPALLFGMGVLALMDRRGRRRRATTLLFWGFGEGVLITLAVSVLFSQTTPLLARYFSAIPFGSVLLIIGTVISGLLYVLHAADKKPRDLFSIRKRRRTPAAAKPANQKGRPSEPSSTRPVTLDLDPPPQREPKPTPIEGGVPQPPPETEIEERRQAVDRLIADRRLHLERSASTSGPRTLAVRYTIPHGLSIRQVAKQCADLRPELGDSCLSVGTRERELTVLFERHSPQVLAFDDVAATIGNDEYALPIYLGRTVEGEDYIADLASLPHLLVAGTSGSGKSVFLHAIVRSLTEGPAISRVRLVLCDPKRVEFAAYSKDEHLACPVLDEPESVVSALDALVSAMEDRYARLAAAKVRSITAYNANRRRRQMSWVVAIIDEVSDLLLSESGRRAKQGIVRLAQKSRAVGIHLVLATQRPSSDVIDGLIKANFPARVAFRTATSVDSRVILDAAGAETLSGAGDGLYVSPELATPIRFQGAYVPDL